MIAKYNQIMGVLYVVLFTIGFIFYAAFNEVTIEQIKTILIIFSVPLFLLSFAIIRAASSSRIIALNQKVEATVFNSIMKEGSKHVSTYYLIGVTYEYQGTSYRRYFTCLDDFEKGAKVTLYVDPKDPLRLAMDGKTISSHGRFQPWEE